MNLHEAIAANERDRRLRPIERKLSRDMAQQFKRQGRVFVRELRQFRSLFPEPVRESIGDLWKQAWAEAVRLTQDVMIKPIMAAARAAFGVGVRDANSGLNTDYDPKSPEAVAYLERYGADRVTMINDTTRATLQTIMANGVAQGLSYQEISKQITERFSEFGAQAGRSRADLIAVTETANAYGEAQRQVAQQAQNQGTPMEKFWSNVGDDRVTQGCRENTGAGWIALDDPFPSGDQREPRFPGCRCTVIYRKVGEDG